MNVSISTLFRIVRSLAPEAVVLWDSAFCQNSVWMNFFFGRGWGMKKWTGIQEWRFSLFLYFRPSAGRPWKGPWVLFGTLWLKYLLLTLHRFVIENNRYYRYSIVDNEAYPGHLSWRRWLIFSRSGLPAMFSRKRNDLAQYFNHKINPLTTWFFSQIRWLDIGVLCILW